MDPICIANELRKMKLFCTVSTLDYKYFVAVAEVHVACPYCWVASGKGGDRVCVFSCMLLFSCFCWFPGWVSG